MSQTIQGQTPAAGSGASQNPPCPYHREDVERYYQANRGDRE